MLSAYSGSPVRRKDTHLDLRIMRYCYLAVHRGDNNLKDAKAILRHGVRVTIPAIYLLLAINYHY